jgi:hypothetical protein
MAIPLPSDAGPVVTDARTQLTKPVCVCVKEREKSGEVVKDTTFRVERKNLYFSGLEGSQAVHARPSGRGSAFNRN